MLKIKLLVRDVKLRFLDPLSLHLAKLNLIMVTVLSAVKQQHVPLLKNMLLEVHWNSLLKTLLFKKIKAKLTL